MDLADILQKFDNPETTKFHEADLSQEVSKLIAAEAKSVPFEIQAEKVAFDFSEGNSESESGWGNYYRPFATFPNADGTSSDYPSYKKLTRDMFSYWRRRAGESQNPMLKARYLGLNWEFFEEVTGEKPSHEIAKSYVNELLASTNGGYCKHTHARLLKLERALSLATCLDDNNLVSACKHGIFKAQTDDALDGKPNLWGHVFDLLIADKKKIELDPSEEKSIIDGLEVELNRFTDARQTKVDPWAAEAAATRLATYYRTRNRPADVHRVLLKVGDAYRYREVNAASLQVSAWLDHLHKLYTQYDLQEPAEEALLRMRDIGPKVVAEMGTFSYDASLPPEKVELYVAEATAGSIREALKRIVAGSIPSQSGTREQIFELTHQRYSLLYNRGQKITDEHGRVLASVGSPAEDLEGNVVLQISQHLATMGPLLRLVMREMRDRKGLRPSDILWYISKTPVIQLDRLSIIETGVRAYFASDHVTAIHLLIPQIEQAVRNLVKRCGGTDMTATRDGGYQVRTFDDMLRDNIIESVFGTDAAHYLRILFTDPRGWNLRNDVCHGVLSPHGFNAYAGDRVVHALLLFGNLLVKPEYKQAV